MSESNRGSEDTTVITCQLIHDPPLNEIEIKVDHYGSGMWNSRSLPGYTINLMTGTTSISKIESCCASHGKIDCVLLDHALSFTSR